MYNVKSTVSSGRIINEDAFIDISHYDYIISSLSSNDLSRYFIISPELFFADANSHHAGMLDIENIIPPHVLSDLKDRKCKLIHVLVFLCVIDSSDMMTMYIYLKHMDLQIMHYG